MFHIFEQSPIAIAILEGPEHRFSFANKLYEKYFLSTEAYRSKSVAELLPDAVTQGFIGILDGVYRTGEPFTGTETPFQLNEEGNVRQFFLNFVYSPYRDVEGNIQGIIASIIDVTEQVRLRNQIAYEKDKLDQIFKVSPAAMAVWMGESLTFQNVNAEYQKIFPGRQLIGQTLLDAVPELKEQGFDQMLLKVLRTGEPIRGTEVLAQIAEYPGGPLQDRYFTFSYLQITDSQGRPIGVYDHAVDVTESVVAKRNLETSERRVRRYAEAMPQMAFTADANGNITYFNQRFYDYVGLPNGDAQGWEWKNYPIHHPEDLARAIDVWSHSVRTGEPYEIEYRLRRSDGVYRWHLGRAIADRDADGNIIEWFGTNTDIHEQRLLAEALDEARIAAEAANSAKSAFLANMSHEIRTPLGAIMGFSDLARQSDTSKQDITSYLNIIERNSTQVLRIIDDILDLAKVESGKVQLEIIETPLTEFLADFSSLMGFRARENGIVFDVSAETPLPDKICTDPTRLRQILTNAVGNAIKFTQKGRVSLLVHYLDGVLKFTIQDTGRGISEAQAKNLFQAFVQADPSTTRKFGGTGLGLVLTKRLCQLMGGDYRLASSELNVGSNFVATLRVDLPTSAKIMQADQVSFSSQDREPSTLIEGRLQGIRVLLVEDSPDNQFLIRLILEKQGARVTIAKDGQDGVEQAIAGNFEVVLMDIQMPRMDGHEAARTLRTKGYKRPIVALTAHAMKEEKERAQRSGFSNFLTKPIQREELIEMVKTYR